MYFQRIQKLSSSALGTDDELIRAGVTEKLIDNNQANIILRKVFFPLILGDVNKDHEVTEKMVMEAAKNDFADLKYTITRPPKLSSSSWTGSYRTSNHHLWKVGVTSRADVADYMVEQLEDPNAPPMTYVGM